VLINEIIGSTVAGLAGAPTPESVIIDVDADFVAASKIPGVGVGLHFGSRRIEGLAVNARAELANVSNSNKFANLVASDAATNNSDRNNDGNILVRIVEQTPRRTEFIAIDFGHTFSHQWDEHIARQQPGWCGSVHPLTVTFINGAASFIEAVAALKAITIEEVNKIIDDVPATWNLSVLKSAAIKPYLFNRLQTVDQLLETHRGSFPNWR